MGKTVACLILLVSAEVAMARPVTQKAFSERNTYVASNDNTDSEPASHTVYQGKDTHNDRQHSPSPVNFQQPPSNQQQPTSAIPRIEVAQQNQVSYDADTHNDRHHSNYSISPKGAASGISNDSVLTATLPSVQTVVPKLTAPEGGRPDSKFDASKRNKWLGEKLGGVVKKFLPEDANEMILPDDNQKTIIWDERAGKWINTPGETSNERPPSPPPNFASSAVDIPDADPLTETSYQPMAFPQVESFHHNTQGASTLQPNVQEAQFPDTHVNRLAGNESNRQKRNRFRSKGMVDKTTTMTNTMMVESVTVTSVFTKTHIVALVVSLVLLLLFVATAVWCWKKRACCCMIPIQPTQNHTVAVNTKINPAPKNSHEHPTKNSPIAPVSKVLTNSKSFDVKNIAELNTTDKEVKVGRQSTSLKSAKDTPVLPIKKASKKSTKKSKRKEVRKRRAMSHRSLRSAKSPPYDEKIGKVKRRSSSVKVKTSKHDGPSTPYDLEYYKKRIKAIYLPEIKIPSVRSE